MIICSCRHSDRSNAVTDYLQDGLSFIICSDFSRELFVFIFFANFVYVNFIKWKINRGYG